MTERVRKNFTLKPRTDDLLNRYSDEWNVSRSEIVEKAVHEYVDADRSARIEDKVDDILAHLEEGGTRSERNHAKKKESTSDSDATTRQRERDMMEYLISEYGDRPFIYVKELEEAIATVWDDSEYMLEKYIPRLQSRLEERGYTEHPVKPSWYQDESTLKTHFQNYWDDAREMTNNPRTIDDQQQVLDMFSTISENSEEFRESLIEYEFADPGEARDVVATAQSYYSRKTGQTKIDR